MILAVDIGNSDIVLGVFIRGEWRHIWRNPTEAYLEAEQTFRQCAHEEKLDLSKAQQVIMSSVVPGVSPTMDRVMHRLTNQPLLWVDAKLFRRMPMLIDNPDEIGSDLVANSIAGFDRVGQAHIVVDFGTALTFTVVDDSGKIVGVNIAPGLKTAFRALFQNTAQIPQVPLEFPASAIGKNTAHALQAGIMLGYVGLVREVIAQIRAEYPQPLKVVATGGLSNIMTPLFDDFDVRERTLTLDGLRLLGVRYGTFGMGVG
ncbi:type III pantothenate kinase [Pontibacter sp. G13]|uniref:type III pantothenate kinase n=1 Tax=Pontibacter sp. G13 TaxID=3074898 RepID=UPI00288B0460|nr:type III pantothenate kinase [Pontibacter sp. G13]WNJ18684.1 type III pantothenate kinase [Pontibacter sp. G13]